MKEWLVLKQIIILSRICVHRPHPNECSGGDLDGDLYFISWDKDLIPHQTEAPVDYTGRRPRIMDHDVTLEVYFLNLVLPYRVEIEVPVYFCYLLFALLISLGELAGNPKVFLLIT